MHYTEEERKEKMTFKGKNFIFECQRDLSTGVIVYSISKYPDDTNILSEDIMLFTANWMINHYQMLDSFPGFDTVKIIVIPF